MATIKEMIKALADCERDDPLYVCIVDNEGLKTFYKIDGLENSSHEYMHNPTLAISGGALKVTL